MQNNRKGSFSSSKNKISPFSRISLYFLVILFFGIHSVTAQKDIVPEWTKDLVIYEINPYAFTSPNGSGKGSGSGTFNSLRKKLSYLEELGINGIWLAGFSNSTDHFFGIKSVYACIRPDELDPALGTPDDFKALIREAHERGIKVFLDVITHGVLNNSPLIEEHPDWFRGESWGMADFDYDNKNFREWWIDTWVNYSLNYGIDGYRLDGPNGFESSSKVLDIWDDIFNRCLEQGDTILICPETCRYHFSQWDNKEGISEILPGFHTDVQRGFDKSLRFMSQQISCHDHGWDKPEGNYYTIKGSRGKFIYNLFGYNIPIFMSGEEFNADQVSLPNLERLLFGGGGDGRWLYGSWLQWEQLLQDKHLDMLNDVKKMFQIKKENNDIIHYDRSQTNITTLTTYPREGKFPYARFIPGRKAIIVITHPNEDDKKNDTFTYRMEIPLSDMQLDDYNLYRLTDLWNDSTVVLNKEELKKMEVNIPPDYQKGGGFRVLKIEPLKEQ